MKFRDTLAPRRGMGVLELLVVVVIIMVLTSLYFGQGRKGVKEQVAEYQTSVQRTESIACTANRSTLASSIQMFQMNSPGVPVTTESLAAANIRVPACPDGGVIDFDSVGKATCSIHP